MPSGLEILLVLALAIGALAMSDLREALSLEDVKATARRVDRSDLPALALFARSPWAARAWVTPDPVPNAFVARGDDIFLTEGLLKLEATGRLSAEEVAAVIAHERAHVELKHYEQMKRRADAAALGGVVVSRFGWLVGWALGQGLRLERLKLSRDAEFEADARAARILAEHGRDPLALARALEALAERKTADAPSWLDTHPPIGERIARLRAAHAPQTKAAS